MDLRYYLQRAYEEVSLNSKAELNAFQSLNVNLEGGRENLILVYGGSFNPLHRGHIDVLQSGLRPEIAAAAIIIIPCDDLFVRNKLIGKKSSFFLRQARRAELWQAVPSFPKTRVWVWKNTELRFKQFSQTLRRLTKSDNFCLEYGLLCGPDNLNLQDPFSKVLPFEYYRIVVTNKARHVLAHFNQDRRPANWKGFGKWSPCSKDGGDVDDIENGATDAVLWTCTIDSDSPNKGYYLTFSECVSRDINSTDLRQSLTRSCNFDEEALNNLSTDGLLSLFAPFL